MADGGQVVKLPKRISVPDAHAIAGKLAADPDVLYAEPDRLLFPTAVPNDPKFSQQWNYQNASAEIGGINLPSAWDVMTGLPSVVVAVIDTGVLNHADLAGRIVAGYDFISDSGKANDGDGRDPDPTDSGNWVTEVEASTGQFAGCDVAESSWHGTHVAGTIGAASNNGIGVAGVAWGTRILPVRVLGKCGGYISDIADGMRWAAGLGVFGVPANGNPAKVLNVSLGGDGPCSITEQNAINDAVSAGAVVVVAAGNENQPAANVSPANCGNVVVVAATDRLGARASYTNFGPIVDISAPGGDTDYGGGSILSTGDGGTTIPRHDNIYAQNEGTSMAVPHVSGVLSLMFSVNPTLSPYSAEQILKSTARVFPAGTAWDCTVSDCGAGVVDAAAAVNAAKSSAPTSMPGQVAGSASGSLSALNLRATITPRVEDSNKYVNLYIGARVGNQWFLRSGSDWVPWLGGALPVFHSMLANGSFNFVIGQNVNVSGLVGTEIYVGYGLNDTDLLDNQKYGLIHTIR